MAAVNLKNMGVDELLSLRSQVDAQLAQKQRELHDALGKLESRLGSIRSKVADRASRLKGRKVAPKFRSPNGETWAGRGARPKWLVSLLKQGRKLDEFLIDKSSRAVGSRKKSGARKTRKRKAA